MSGNGDGLLSQPAEAVQLSNGTRVLMRPQSHTATVAIEVLMDATLFDEPERHPGLANLTLRALRRGTAHRDAAALADALESLGAHLQTGMGSDQARVGLQIAAADLEIAVPLLAEVLFEPAFDTEEVGHERDQILAEIRLQDDHPFHLAMRHFRKALFGSHPYGRPVEGTRESVESLTTGLARTWWRGVRAPEATVIAAVGDFEPRTMARLLETHLGNRAGEADTPDADRLRPLGTHRPRRLTVHRDTEQAMVLVGWPGPSIRSLDDAAALKVAAAVLGGGMSSRLFRRLRDEQGLAYSVGCTFQTRRATGALIGHIGTHPDQAADAGRQIVREVQALGREGAPPDEVERAKTYLRGTHLIDHQTNARQAWHLGWGVLAGMGQGFDAEWLARIQAVTPDAVQGAVRRHVRTPTMVTLRPHRERG